MISKVKLDNLIAQTNYLSSMLQTYQSILTKKAYDRDSESMEKESNYQDDSLFESSQSEQKQEDNCLSESEPYQNLASFYLNNDNFHEELFGHEMLDKPTTYTNADEERKRKYKIGNIECAIQICFEAVQIQFSVKKELGANCLLSQGIEAQPLRSLTDLNNHKKEEKKLLKKASKKKDTKIFNTKK